MHLPNFFLCTPGLCGLGIKSSSTRPVYRRLFGIYRFYNHIPGTVNNFAQKLIRI